MKFLKLLGFYFAVCCLHSHLTVNFLCNTKEFLILVLFHKREEYPARESKRSRDYDNGFFWCEEYEGQNERHWYLRDVEFESLSYLSASFG